MQLGSKWKFNLIQWRCLCGFILGLFCLNFGCYSGRPIGLDSDFVFDSDTGTVGDTETASGNIDTNIDTEIDTDIDTDGDTDADLDSESGDTDSSLFDDSDSQVDSDSDFATDTESLGNGFVTHWKTDVEQSGKNNQITLPLVENGTYQFTVDWGDGLSDAISNWEDERKVHTYAVPGTYEVTISGQINGWSFGDHPHAKKLVKILNWGPLALGNTSGHFFGCHSMEITATDSPDLTQTESFEKTFEGCASLTGVPFINQWDTSNITNMGYMFSKATRFNQDLSGWDTSNVTNMFSMFYKADAFNGDISSWDTTAVTHMGTMFAGAECFNGDISSWNTANVTHMNFMFYRAYSFNQNLSIWNTSNVTDMSWMFAYTNMFNQDLSNWDTSSVIDMSYLFDNAVAFNQPLGTWNTSSVIDMSYMFYGAPLFNQDISNWDTSAATNLNVMFKGAKRFDQNLSSWNITNVFQMDDLFEDAALSTANYDALLIAWASQAVQSYIRFSAGNTQYSSAALAARNSLTNPQGPNWTIEDGGISRH